MRPEVPSPPPPPPPPGEPSKPPVPSSLADLLVGLRPSGGGAPQAGTGPDINATFSGQVPGFIPLNIEVNITESEGAISGSVNVLQGQTLLTEFGMSGEYDRQMRKVTLSIQLDPPLSLSGEVSPDGNMIETDLGIVLFRGGGRGSPVEGLFIGSLGVFQVPLLGEIDISLSVELFEAEPGSVDGFFDTRVGGEFLGFGEVRGSAAPADQSGARHLTLTFFFQDRTEVTVEAVLPFDQRVLEVPQFQLLLHRGRFLDGTVEEIGEDQFTIFNEFSEERFVVRVSRNTRFLLGPSILATHAEDVEGEALEEDALDFVDEGVLRGKAGLQALRQGEFAFVLAIEGLPDEPLLALEVEQGGFFDEGELDFEENDDSLSDGFADGGSLDCAPDDTACLAGLAGVDSLFGNGS
ncbi:MAG: hypothetical protein HYY96_17985 [Candidatus Tectomicrobia bacterium]|nr:hypothetical protein [Candidatus Tectomicrobia bacterium]